MTTTANITQDLMIKTIVGLQKAVETGWDFAREQLPDMAVQFVAFGRAYDSFIIALCIAVFIGIYFFVKKAFTSDDGDVKGAAIVIGIVGGIVSFVIFFANIKSFMMVWFAPKIWLMLELAKFLK